MIELARATSMFRQPRRVNRVAILEHRACRTAAVRHIVLRTGTIYLLRPQIIAIVGKRVAASSWIRDADDAVLSWLNATLQKLDDFQGDRFRLVIRRVAQ